jgi:hypothetical protein
MSPLEDGKLADHAAKGEKHMRNLWGSYTTHPAMMAWGADWLVGKFQDSGMAWRDLRDKDAALPEHMSNCNPRQLRTACALMDGTIKPKEPQA